MSKSFNSRKPPRKKKDDGPRFFTSKDGTPMISSPAPPGPYNRRALTPDYAAINDPITRAGRQVRQLVDSISDAIEDTAKEAWKNTTEGLMFLSERDITRRLLRFQRNPIFGVTDVIADSINEIIELLATPKPPPPSPGAGGLYPPGAPFNKYPTRSLCDAYRAQGGALSVNTNQHFCWMQRRRYVDHRQQWEARAVALGSHPWYQYLGNEGANSFFSYWTWNRATEEWNARVGSASTPPANFWKNWTWGGPPPDTSDLTAGQYMITWMTWATYFLVNAIPQSKTWDGLAFSANREIPCQFGDHKDPAIEGGGPDNPYGPEGCINPDKNDDEYLGFISGRFRLDRWNDYSSGTVDPVPFAYVSSSNYVGSYHVVIKFFTTSSGNAGRGLTLLNEDFEEVTGPYGGEYQYVSFGRYYGSTQPTWYFYDTQSGSPTFGQIVHTFTA